MTGDVVAVEPEVGTGRSEHAGRTRAHGSGRPSAMRRRPTRTRGWRSPAVPHLDDRAATGRSAGARTWSSLVLRRLIVLDVLVGVLAGLAGWLTQRDDVRYGAGALLVAAVWIVALTLSGAYDRRRLTFGSDQFRLVIRGCLGIVAAVALLAYLGRVAPPRDYLFLVVAVLAVGGSVVRWMVRQWLRKARAQGRLMQRTVVVGRADSAAALVRSLASECEQGLLPVAVCASGLDGTWDMAPQIEGVPVLSTPDLAVEAVDLCDAEVVAVASHPDLAGPALRRLSWALEDRGVELIVAPGLLDVAGPRLSIRPSRHLSLLHVERPAAVRMHVLVKSVLDRCAAAILLLLASPLLVTVALAVKLGDGGPVFFRQERVGVAGRTFHMYKFRTMVVDAEDRLEALQAASEGNGVLFKMARDPRITRVGGVLRRYSIDELPQLLNVLFGDMSLVGPRPPLPREVAQYEPDAHRRLHVRPGMTGLWQVSGRSDLSWEDSLRLDLHYVDNWSPLGDLHILARTVQAVVRSDGAY